jgi:predicted Zn-dependent protease
VLDLLSRDIRSFTALITFTGALVMKIRNTAVRFSVAFLLIIAVLATGCSSRTAIKPGEIPKGREISKGERAAGMQTARYLASKFPLLKNKKVVEGVRRITSRLVRAADIQQNTWNIVVFNNDSVINAAATSGNYIFVWTGLLKFVNSEDELASVLAHEMGHALAGHSLEDSLEDLTDGFVNRTAKLSTILNKQTSYQQPATSQADSNARLAVQAASLALAVTSLGAKKLFSEPEQHRKEIEADTIGLFVMAEAGYDPHATLSVIKRIEEMERASGGGYRFIKSHPAPKKRIKNIEKLMPEATARYEGSPFRFLSKR